MSAVSRRSFAAASASALVSAAAVLAHPAVGVAAPQIPFEDAIANLMLAKVSKEYASSASNMRLIRSILARASVDYLKYVA
jgi:hypothetical protein